ncbi:MAG: alpha/beta hydrolase [Huintestinicola sp.]
MNMTVEKRKIPYNNKEISVSVMGSGDKIIVMLSGFGSPAPSVEFKALASGLSDKFKAVIIDYLDYGESSPSDTERTNENISEEIHFALSFLGYDKYSICAHSLSGIYGLYYANKYPNEVEAFIGLDSTVPQLIDDPKFIRNNLKMCEMRRKKANSKLFCNMMRNSAKMLLKTAKGYTFSDEDIRLYSDMMIASMPKDAYINELNCAQENLSSLKGAKLPDSIPALFLLSSKTAKAEKNWVSLHSSLTSNPDSRTEILKGSHLLHIDCADKAAQEINSFISG